MPNVAEVCVSDSMHNLFERYHGVLLLYVLNVCIYEASRLQIIVCCNGAALSGRLLASGAMVAEQNYDIGKAAQLIFSRQ